MYEVKEAVGLGGVRARARVRVRFRVRVRVRVRVWCTWPPPG